MQELLDLFKRNWRQNEKQVFLCCFISISAKQWMSAVSLITQTVFGHFDKIFRSSKGHFCTCQIIIKMLSVLYRKVYRSHSVCFKAIP